MNVTPELTDIQSVFALDNFSKSATPPTYDLSVPSFVRQTQSYYDFDKDGEYETTVLGRVVEVPVEGGEEGETEKLFFPQTDQDYPCVTSRDEQGELCSHQGVYLSSTGNLPAEAQPDILRIADWGLSDDSEFQDKGLATEMGEIDLSNTDLYIFRESNGELIAERRGLNTSEANASTKGLQGAADGRFFYTLEMRGPREGIYSASYLRRNPRDPVTGNPVGPQNAYRFWQQQSGVVEKFWNREADHLRPGERIRIIAINRVTGYMGSVTTELKAHSNTDTDDNGDTIERNAMMIDYSVNDIVMGPPNLKVWAERSYTVEQGLTRGTQYLGDDARDPTDDSQKAAPVIGFEGAGLGTDTAIVVYTEWLDQDGRALPEALGDYGYTARFAKIVAPNQLDDAAVGQADDGSGAVAQFPIKPGKHTSVIRFSNPNSNREHLYIHVSGQPFTRQADFEQLQVFQTTDASTGMQESRPDRYVPIKVPVYNEDESLQAQKTYRDYVEAQGEDADITTPKPEPIYEWLYRPEFQFSVYDLTEQEIRREISEEEVLDVYGAELPSLASSDALITFAYNLLSRDINSDGLDNDTLSAFTYDGDRELVIALGEEEVLATVGSDKTITFENLDVLSLLAPEDFLSMRLYSNNDTANILWEWAFEYLYADYTELDEFSRFDECKYVSADNPTTDFYALIPNFENRTERPEYSVRWILEGGGTLSTVVEPVDDYGFSLNTAQLPTTAGEEYPLSVQIVNSETLVDLGNICVEPGEPTQITLVSQTGDIYLGGIGEQTIEFLIQDAWGNPIKNGTAVDFSVEGNLDVLEFSESTQDGKASIMLTSGERLEAINQVTVSVGTGLSQLITVDVQPILLTVSAPPQINAKETVPVSVSLSPALEGVDITLGSDVGLLEGKVVTTDASGSATVEMLAAPQKVQGKVTAFVSFDVSDSQEVEVIDSKQYLDIAVPVLVGDDLNSGSILATDGFGYDIDVAYDTTIEVDVKGEAGETVEIQLGGNRFPVERSLLRYPMVSIVGGQSYDKSGANHAQTYDIDLIDDTPNLRGKSYLFTEAVNAEEYDSTVTLTDTSSIQIADNWLIRTKLKLDGQNDVGSIFNLAQGVRLNVLPDHSLELTATLGGTAYQLQTDTIGIDQWHSVAVKYYTGTLSLEVNNVVVASAAASGSTNYSQVAASLIIGAGFNGKMVDFEVYAIGSAVNALMTFDDGALSKSVVVGADGTASVTIVSTNKLDPNASAQKVQLIANGEEYEIYAVSKMFHEQLALKAALKDSQYIDAVMNQVADTAMVSPPTDWFISSAYAAAPIYTFGLDKVAELYKGTVALMEEAWFYVPDAQFYEDVWEGLKQVGQEEFENFKDNLRNMAEEIGEAIENGELTDAQAVVLLLRVATTVPLVRRYLGKAIDPLIKFLKRFGNTKAGKHIAGYLLKVLKPAVKDGDFDPLFAALYGMIFIADLMEVLTDDSLAELHETVTEIINGIDSPETVSGIFNFVRLSLNNLDASCQVDLNLVEAVETTSISDFFMSPAYAANRGFLAIAKRIPIKTFVKRLRSARQKFDVLDENQVPGQGKKSTISQVIARIGTAMAAIDVLSPSEQAKALLENILDERLLLAMMVVSHRGGVGAIESLFKNELPLRMNILELMSAIAFIEQKASEGALDTQNYRQLGGIYSVTPPRLDGRLVKWKIRDKYKSIFIDVVPKGSKENLAPKNKKATYYVAVNKMNGEAFHLVKIASLLAQGQNILGVEAETGTHILSVSNTPIGPFIQRRVDIVTGTQESVGGLTSTWWEVKSLSYNTKRKTHAKDKIGVYKKAMCTLDINQWDDKCSATQKITKAELALLLQDTDANGNPVKVKANQFYTKEFFVDRAYAGADTAIAPQRMQWIVQDFSEKMPQFEGRGSKIVISNAPKFVQCGINRTICSAYEANTDPLNDVRDRLVNGIRYTKTKESDLKKIAYTIRGDLDPDDVNDYVSEFAAIKSDIIKSENAKDWLIQYTAAQISKQCEAE